MVLDGRYLVVDAAEYAARVDCGPVPNLLCSGERERLMRQTSCLHQ